MDNFGRVGKGTCAGWIPFMGMALARSFLMSCREDNTNHAYPVGSAGFYVENTYVFFPKHDRGKYSLGEIYNKPPKVHSKEFFLLFP